MATARLEATGAAAATPEDHDADHLRVVGVGKRFGDVVAVDDASLGVRKGEILAFLGPSGCGKSTLLNMIAGFERPDQGELWLAGKRIDTLPPGRRGAAMVFQHYALFPHMTVAGNIGYGLKARGQPHQVVTARVGEMLRLLQLKGLEDRYPGALSGGQRQRVAIARALAIRPSVLLLDEALSALDKNLREAMQIELSLLLRSLDITTILVTHDQREAFAVGDRIALMDAGRIVQVGPPQAVYDAPGSRFAIEFLGSANRFPVRALHNRTGQTIAETAEGLSIEVMGAAAAADPGELGVFVRSEDIRLSQIPTACHASGPGIVRLDTFMGDRRRVIVQLGDRQVVADIDPHDAAVPVAAGLPVFLDIDCGRVHLLTDTPKVTV